MTPPLSQPSSFAKGYGGQEGKAMKLKIDWKELGRQLWEVVKECLGGSLLAVAVASGETHTRFGRGAALPRARHTLVSGETHARFGRGTATSRARHGNASPEGCGSPAAVSQWRKLGQALDLVVVSARR